MKSLISSAKKISFDCRVQIRRYELKKQKTGKKWRERQRQKQTDRQTDREIETETERGLNFQIKKKKIQSSSPSLSPNLPGSQKGI